MGQKGNNAAHLLSCSPLSKELSCEFGIFSQDSNHHSSQLTLSLSSTFSQPRLCGPPPHQAFSQTAQPAQSSTSLRVLTGMIWFIFFFNSLFVRVPCSLIFWHFWLFIHFRLVVILLLVVQGSEGFLPMPPSWPELPRSQVLEKEDGIEFRAHQQVASDRQ